jgi:biofilm PGA synthesis N-glycosyltransferase PgaC
MGVESFVHTFVYWSFIVCFSYLFLLYAITAVLAVVASVENLTRKCDAQADDYDALLYSRFTIPVSVIVPAYNEQGMIATVVRRLLDFEYPEFEVVVVNDGSTDGMVEVLEKEFALESIERYYRKTLQTKRVRAVYRSKTDPRLIVIDKENGGKADALNCGLNFSRYRYVCCVDGDSIYHRQALLVAMRPVVKDPATVIGLTSLVAVGRVVDSEDTQTVGHKEVDHHVWTNLQHLEILRAFLNNRLAWSRMQFMICVSGAFAIWRRDVLLEVGGFSSDFTCEDIEMTFRILEKFLRERRPVKILSLPDMVGTTEGPERVASLISQRARWQRVILETVWHYRRMLFNRRYGAVGLLGMPYLVISECLGPFMEVLVIVTLAAALAFQLLNWTEFLALLGIQVFAVGIMSSVSLWMNDASFRYYRLRELVRLVLIGPLDLCCYRPVLIYAYARGVVEFLCGDKRWHRFERNARRTAA